VIHVELSTSTLYRSEQLQGVGLGVKDCREQSDSRRSSYVGVDDWLVGAVVGMDVGESMEPIEATSSLGGRPVDNKVESSSRSLLEMGGKPKRLARSWKNGSVRSGFQRLSILRRP
jgi:hypothetical protein